MKIYKTLVSAPTHSASCTLQHFSLQEKILYETLYLFPLLLAFVSPECMLYEGYLVQMQAIWEQPAPKDMHSLYCVNLI